jgi:hypothetical protein
MMEAEEKVNKMKEDYMRAREKELAYADEIDKLKIKLNSLDISSSVNNSNNKFNDYFKQNKGNFIYKIKEFLEICLKPLEFKDPIY